MSLFVGRLPTYDFDDRDLEDIFYKYGRVIKCQIKRGNRFSFGFVEFEDPEDAYDAMRNVDGLDIDGVPIVVERTKSSPRRSNDSSTCFNCGRYGHWARDCLEPSNDDDYYRRRSRSRYRDDYDRSRSYSRSRSPYGRRRYDDYYSRSRSRSPRRYGRSRSPYGRYYSRSRSPSRD